MAAAGLVVTSFPEVRGGSTTWDPAGSSTNWHSDSNWSNGEPGITTEAEIADAGSGTISIGNTTADADHLRLLTTATRNWQIIGSTTLNLDTDQSGGTGYTLVNESNGYLLTINTNLNLSNGTAPGGDDSKFFASTGDIIVNGNINFNAVDPHVEASSGRTVTFNGALSGASTVTKQGVGAWVIGGSSRNTYTGSTVISDGQVTLQKTSGNAIAGSSIVLNGGSLVFGGSNQIGDSTSLTLAGGDVFLNDFSDTLGSLTLSTDSTIDLGSDAGDGSVLSFANSSANGWTGDLFITDWNGDTDGGGLDQVFFGNNASALTGGQVGSIFFVDPGNWNGIYSARILSTGEVVPVPVPEPGTYAAGACMVLALGLFEWRRRVRRDGC